MFWKKILNEKSLLYNYYKTIYGQTELCLFQSGWSRRNEFKQRNPLI